jgi:hypothetical protein
MVLDPFSELLVKSAWFTVHDLLTFRLIFDKEQTQTQVFVFAIGLFNVNLLINLLINKMHFLSGRQAADFVSYCGAPSWVFRRELSPNFRRAFVVNLQ